MCSEFEHHIHLYINILSKGSEMENHLQAKKLSILMSEIPEVDEQSLGLFSFIDKVKERVRRWEQI